MTLSPLIDAPAIVQVHALAAMLALGLGVAQFVLPKGTLRHRIMGFAWIGLMALIAGSSFGIHRSRQFGPFGAIHLLSVFTLGMLVLGILHARAGRIEAHRWTMIGLFAGALVITGLFTLMPGRVMHGVVFGPVQNEALTPPNTARPTPG